MLAKEMQTEKSAKVLALLQGNVARMSGLIDNVLDFARGRLGGGILLNRDLDLRLEPLLQQVVDELQSSNPDRTIEVHFDLPNQMNGDGSRISQLASNLLGNAITHGDPSQPIRISASIQDGLMELAVANGGTPIASAAMERLFQPFFRGEVRTNQEGLGLGLHIASEIARAHGGSIAVASNLDETRFTFSMPLV